MIVEPDFFGHWKTLMLVGLTQSEPSPLCVLKLWAYCHQRRRSRFEKMTPQKLAAICQWKGEAEVIWDALFECEFVKMEDAQFVVHDWDVINSVLVRNWKNGKNGGRKKGTQAEPSQNPVRTQAEPKPNPTGTDEIREDESKKKKIKKKTATASPADDFLELVKTDRFVSLSSVEFHEAYLAYLAYRQSSSKKIKTRRAVELHLIDALKVGPQVAIEFLLDAEKNSWTGWFFPERVEEYRERATAKRAAPTRPLGFEGS